MSYDLHITRKEFWSDEEGARIEFEEWKQYVSTDKSIVSDPANDENSFIIQIGSQIQPIWYEPSLGELYTSAPNKEFVCKMVEIAESIQAKVLGDDDERYGLNGDLYQESEVVTESQVVNTPNPKKYFWQFWKKS